ncbi:MAG: YybH family protein [Paracoccaceae bacterium]
MPHKTQQSEIDTLVQRADAANAAFMNGDAASSFAMNRHSADFSIMTPFGGHTAGGYNPTPDQLAAMAQRFPSATTAFEVIATYGSGDLVVIAAIERQHGIVGDLPPQDWSLRVTLVYRRTGTDWELVHRHADPLVKGISLEQLAAMAR